MKIINSLDRPFKFSNMRYKHEVRNILCFIKHISTSLSLSIYIYIERERDYYENICISADIQTDQKLYFNISKILIYDFH
jgi:hypothetical protein